MKQLFFAVLLGISLVCSGCSIFKKGPEVIAKQAVKELASTQGIQNYDLFNQDYLSMLNIHGYKSIEDTKVLNVFKKEGTMHRIAIEGRGTTGDYKGIKLLQMFDVNKNSEGKYEVIDSVGVATIKIDPSYIEGGMDMTDIERRDAYIETYDAILGTDVKGLRDQYNNLSW